MNCFEVEVELYAGLDGNGESKDFDGYTDWLDPNTIVVEVVDYNAYKEGLFIPHSSLIVQPDGILEWDIVDKDSNELYLTLGITPNPVHDIHNWNFMVFGIEEGNPLVDYVVVVRADKSQGDFL